MKGEPMHAPSDIPKPVADLCRWLSDHPEPVPFAELPERLRNPDVLTVGERRGLIVRATRIEAETTRWDGRNLCVGHSGGWQLATPGDDPDRVFVGLTREGRARVAEWRLAAKPVSKAKPKRRKRSKRETVTVPMMKAFTLWQAGSDYRKIGETLGVSRQTVWEWVRHVRQWNGARSVRAKASGSPDPSAG